MLSNASNSDDKKLVMMLIVITITLFVQFDFIYELVTKNSDPTKIGIILGGLSIGFYLFSRYVKKATSGIGLKIKDFIALRVLKLAPPFRSETGKF